MALPSSLFSFAARIRSLHQSHIVRALCGSQKNFVIAKDNIQDSVSRDSYDPDLIESESNTVVDIEVDDTLSAKDYFGVRKLCTPQLLFKHKVHYGHNAAQLDPGMKQFVYGIRSNHVIFDLDITNYHLQEALNIAAHIALRDGIILFVGRLPHCANLIEKTANDCGEFAHVRVWDQGTLVDITTKQRMECRLPDLMIFLSTKSELGTEHVGVSEAAKLNIPTIGIVDSNCSPNMITYPVPGNDDSTSAIQLYCSLFHEAISRGKKERAHRLALLEKERMKEQQQRQNILSQKAVK